MNLWQILIIGRFIFSVSGSSYCRERNRLIGTDKSDKFQLIDAQRGKEVVMDCHYCNEHDDHEAKVWYKQDILFKEPPREVQLGMANSMVNNRVHLTPEHALVVRNVTEGDEGLYFCHGVHGEQTKNKFNYIMDMVFGNETLAPLTGNLTNWSSYQEKYIHPLSRMLRASSDPEIARLREQLSVQLDAVSEWQHWGPCLSCNRASGVRTRAAKCRVKPIVYENFTRNGSDVDDSKVALLLTVYQLSCQSAILNSVFPELSALTRRVPDFIRKDECVGKCKQVDADGKVNATTREMLKKRYILPKHSHLVLVCPEMTMEAVVTWRKDGEKIDAERAYRALTHDLDEPRIAIDTFNTLYLHDVTHEQAGNYTCFLDDVIVLAADVKVVAKSLLLSHAFLRHLVYIAFVFLLTCACYCARVAVLCTQRHKFQPYTPVPTPRYPDDFEGSDDQRDDGDDDD